MKISGLFKAKVTKIGPKNELTGIYKYPIEHANIDKLGIQGDVQVDKRYHGGPERALHQYAWKSYEQIIKAYPLLHTQAWPGSMGENLSIATMHEKNVNIGDIYQINDCHIQVSGPRMPCFKISERFNTPNLHKFVAKQAIHGWYYRVIKSGSLELNNTVKLIHRPNPDITIAAFLDLVQGKIEDQQIIYQTINAIDLDPEWKEKLSRQFPST